MELKIKMPQKPKAKVMLWTDISHHDMAKLNNIQSIPELQDVLNEMLEIDLPDPKRGILLDLYIQTIFYCRKKHFTPAQTSTLLSILKSIHTFNVETVMNNIAYCHIYCKELLLCHSVRVCKLSKLIILSLRISHYKAIFNHDSDHPSALTFITQRK
ncbi:hypothetical protein WMY93_011037 [Mugilogobius chulae]|uniref:Uncharacterized protein n=1 Tax=Mugilogobius chulae TaxID=88201 RepID=A0AAW0PFI7_9GOBI